MGKLAKLNFTFEDLDENIFKTEFIDIQFGYVIFNWAEYSRIKFNVSMKYWRIKLGKLIKLNNDDFYDFKIEFSSILSETQIQVQT